MMEGMWKPGHKEPLRSPGGDFSGEGEKPLEKKLSKKERARALQDLYDQAMPIVRGVEGVADPLAFEEAAKKYMEHRTRKGNLLAQMTRLGVVDARDSDRLLSIMPQLEALTIESGLAKPDEREKEEKASEPDDEGVERLRMTEEELLRGLEGLAPPERKEYVRPPEIPEGFHEELGVENGREVRFIVSDDGKMRAVKELRPGDKGRLEGIDWPKSKLPKPEETERESLQHQSPEMDDADISDRQRRISAESKQRKREKREKKLANREVQKSATEENEARIRELADEFDRQARADHASAADLYIEMRDSLPKVDAPLFKRMVEALGWEVNGDVHQEKDTTEGIELIPLKTMKDLRARLGDLDGAVDGLPYWNLEDGDAAVYGEGDTGALRVAPGGMIGHRGRWYGFDGKTFKELSEEELRNWRTRASQRSATLKRAAQELPVAEESPREEDGEEPKRERRREKRAEETLDPERMFADVPSAKSEDEYGLRGLHDLNPEQRSPAQAEARRIFEQLYFDQGTDLTEAYWSAIQNLSAQDRRAFDDSLSDMKIDRRELARVIDDARKTLDRRETRREGREHTLLGAQGRFAREHLRERKPLGVAYRDAVGGLSEKDRRAFNDFVRTLGLSSAMLDRVIQDADKDRDEKARGGQRRRT